MPHCQQFFSGIRMMAALIAWAKEQMLAYGLWFLFAFTFTEAFIQPIPVEPVLLAGLGFHIATPKTLLFLASLASLLGGCLGFWLGKRYGHPVFLKVFTKNGQKWMEWGEKFFAKWGVWAVFMCAFTPIPFKVAAWLSGIFEMKFWQFFVAAALGRIPRFAIVIYGIDFFLN